jgi:hypothetical protein
MTARVPAIGWGDHQVVVVIDVAGGASHVGMTIGQQKTGRAVVKLCIQECVHSVALLARCRESCCHVVRIVGLLEISRMA